MDNFLNGFTYFSSITCEKKLLKIIEYLKKNLCGAHLIYFYKIRTYLIILFKFSFLKFWLIIDPINTNNICSLFQTKFSGNLKC